MLDFKTALEKVVGNYRRQFQVEQLSLLSACGRYLAGNCYSDAAVPGVDNSAMDGYAVCSNDIAQGKSYSVSQRIAAGDESKPLQSGTVARLFTGAMMPEGADAVILQEDAVFDEYSKSVRFMALPERGQHIRKAGQDIKEGALLAESGERLTPAALGLLASTGIASVSCFKPLRVAFFSTGDELKEPGESIKSGQIYNSNRYALLACLEQLGVEVVDLGFCSDDSQATAEMLIEASRKADCVMTTGGMSVGEEDYVREQADKLGQIDFWKIAIKPGKPFAFGKLGEAWFFGLPGNPVSSFVTFQLFVRPWLLKSMGAKDWQHRYVLATSSFDFYNKGRRLDFLRGNIEANDSGQLIVSKFENQSSGVMSSIARSNVLIPVAPHSEVRAGEQVSIIPLVDVNLFGASAIWLQ